MTEEYLDILDKNGNPTGEKALRSTAHKNGLTHRSVFVFIINDNNQILLQKRVVTKLAGGNLWDVSVGGHISSGSNSADTAVTEIKEELGLDVGKNQLEFLFNYHERREWPEKNHINDSFFDVYLVRLAIDPELIEYDKEEVADVKLVSLPDFKKAINDKDPAFTQHDKLYPKLFSILD